MLDNMAERLSLCKKYMIVEHDEDDNVILSILNAVDAYLNNCGVSRDIDTNLYDTIAHDMVLRIFDGRDDDVEHAATSQIARQMLNQLKIKCTYGDINNAN